MIKIDKNNYKLTFRFNNNTDNLLTAELFIKRVGDPYESIVYGPSNVLGEYIVFTFDSLLLSREFGRFQARLEIEGKTRTSLQLQYSNITTISAA